MKWLVGLVALTAWAQGGAFEAVSVKPWIEGTPLQWSGCQGGPGSNDPGRIECRYVTLRVLVSRAFGMKSQETFGPAWMDDVRFNVGN